MKKAGLDPAFFVCQLSNNPAERFFQRPSAPTDPGGTAVWAMGWIVAFVELNQQVLDLPVGKMLVGPYGPVAGHQQQALVNGFFQTGRKADLGHFFHDFNNKRLNLPVCKKGRHSLYHKSISSKGLYCKAHFFKIRDKFCQDIRFSKPKIDSFGNKEFLG